MKLIYEFEIQKEVEVDKTETREENGAIVTVTTKVKEQRPIYFAIKRPSRNEKEEGEMHRAAFFAHCIEKGIITQAALRKKYGDTGGIYTNEEEKQYSILRKNLRDALEEYKFLDVTPTNESSTEKEERIKNRDAKFDEVFSIRNQILEFENASTLFYQDTAEAKARSKLIEFFVLNLGYWRDDTSKEWTPFFKGETIEQKIKHLSELEDGDDELYLKVGERLALVITLVLVDPNISKEQIKNIEKEAV